MVDLAPWDRHLSLSCANAEHMRCDELAFCVENGGIVECLCSCHITIIDVSFA